MKTNANLVIVDTRRNWRGRAIPVVGKKLREALPRLRRQMPDVEVRARFKRRAYRGKQSYKTRGFRVIAGRNHKAGRYDEAGRYHCYITNIPTERLPAEEITATYALRWQVELLFKSTRQHGYLGHTSSSVSSGRPSPPWPPARPCTASSVVLTWASVPRRRAIPMLPWGAQFAGVARELLRAIGGGGTDQVGETLAHLRRNAPDPNVNRPGRALEPVFPGVVPA